MTMGNAYAQALASCTSAMASRHVCRSPGLFYEDEARGVEFDLAVEPFLPALQDVGMATAFLAHDAARLITGKTLYVDGGYHIID